MISRRKLTARIVFGLLMASGSLTAQEQTADLREDVRGLTQRVNDLSLRVEQLEHENAELKTGLQQAQRGVTPVQLNAAIAEMNTEVQSSIANSRTEILDRVGTQMEKLAKQTNAALDSLSKPAAPEPAKIEPASAHSGDGISYTVQKGDSLVLVSKKTGGKVQDIIDANKLTDPSHIRVGQVLFIPGGK